MAYTGSVPLSPEREAMKRATYEDVLNAPENKVAEILDGELVLSPRPALRHARAASRLAALLGDPFDRGRGGPGGWAGKATVRAEPFDAIELGALWPDAG